MDLRLSKLLIQIAFWALVCEILLMSFRIFYYIELTTWLNFLDPVILIVLAYFVKGKSRVAMGVLVIYQFMFQVILLPQTKQYEHLLWFIIYILGFFAMLRYQKLVIENGGDEE